MDPISNNPFKYTHGLEGVDYKFTIRALELLPSRDHDSPIACSTKHVDLDDDGSLPYEGLSYFWEDAKTKETVLVDNKHLDIGPSLYDALCHFRHLVEPLVTWIDPVCINQQDVEEKNFQVPLMRKIYSGARNFKIWLGSSQPEEERLDVVNFFYTMHDIREDRIRYLSMRGASSGIGFNRLGSEDDIYNEYENNDDSLVDSEYLDLESSLLLAQLARFLHNP